MNNIRSLTATPYSMRCTLCDRWMLTGSLCQTVQYVCISGMRHQLVLCMECATDGPLECDCEVDE